MTAQQIERFRRIEALFDAAIEHPAGPERAAFLGREPDQDLVAEVRKLLAGDERVKASVPSPPEPLPTFGAWQAIRLLGRGGMGVVYLAERADGAFKMYAAVKVVPLALASLDIEERFRRERQFLASLEHPKIARLIDGGLTSAGLPYLVMDYVDGVPIDRYCESHTLDTRARIGLMRQVLEALRYVHGRQVIHRDLKGSNILVDSGGNAKLLDFGTARLADASGDDLITRSGAFAFTPEYASPEQVVGKPLTFTTDVYSAGVLLRKLIGGASPDTMIAAIIDKALQANPEKRYRSAQEMDADLARYLQGQPVEAHQPRKLAAVALVAALAIVGAIGGWLDLRRNAPAKPASIAVLPFAGGGYLASGITSEVTEKLAGMKTLRVIAQGSAVEAAKMKDVRKAGPALHVDQLLMGSVEKEGDGIKVVASLLRASDGTRVWANTYFRPVAGLSGMEADLASAVVASLGIESRTQQRKHVPSERAHDYLLKARFEDGQGTFEGNKAAIPDARRAVELDPNYADAWVALGTVLWNQPIVAGPGAPSPEAFRQALDCYRKAIQLDPDNARAHNGIGMHAMYRDWDWDRAERELRAAVASGSVGAEGSLARLCLITGRRAEADEHDRRYRDMDPLNPITANNRASFLRLEGRLAEAREEYAKLLAAYPASLYYQALFYGMDGLTGKLEEGMRNLRKMPQGDPTVAMVLAILEALAGHRDEALRLMQSVEKRSGADINPMHWAQLYAGLGDEANVFKYLDRAVGMHVPMVTDVPVLPDFAKWRHTPEFRRILKRMNLDR